MFSTSIVPNLRWTLSHGRLPNNPLNIFLGYSFLLVQLTPCTSLNWLIKSGGIFRESSILLSKSRELNGCYAVDLREILVYAYYKLAIYWRYRYLWPTGFDLIIMAVKSVIYNHCCTYEYKLSHQTICISRFYFWETMNLFTLVNKSLKTQRRSLFLK